MEIIIRNNIKYKLDTVDKTAKVIFYRDEPVEVIIPEFIRCRFRKYKVTSIGNDAFFDCSSLTSIDIPNSVTYIGNNAFDNIGLTLPKRYTNDGKLIAYKAFKSNMKCLDFQYEEGKSYEKKCEIKLCNRGFHACINPLHIFNYYWGAIGNKIYINKMYIPSDILIHEVYLSGDIDDDDKVDSKVCGSKIEIGRRLTMKDINNIINYK